MRLAFVIPDFYLPDHLPEKIPAPLEKFAAGLRFASVRKLAGDWRDWVVASLSDPNADSSQEAKSLARQLWDSPDPPACCWFADPIHCRPTLDRVQLAGNGCLRLDEEDMAELLTRFARDFSGSGWQLVDARDGRLLLGIDRVVEPVKSVFPQRLLGRDVAPALSTGPGAAVLRAASAEIEMWLFGSPLNRQRQMKNLPPITQLWLWDRLFPTGPLRKREDVHSAPVLTTGRRSRIKFGVATQLVANEAFIAKLAQAQDLEVRRDRPALGNLLADRRPAIVVQSVHETAGSSLLEFAADWLEPALQSLKTGVLSELSVVANDTEYRLTRLGFWRFWRLREDPRDLLLR